MKDLNIRAIARVEQIPFPQEAPLTAVFPRQYSFTRVSYHMLAEAELLVLARIALHVSAHQSWKPIRVGELVPVVDSAQSMSDWFSTVGIIVSLFSYGVVELWNVGVANPMLHFGLHVVPKKELVSFYRHALEEGALIVK